jgi:hyperosmotically inducible periplasmic protein
MSKCAVRVLEMALVLSVACGTALAQGPASSTQSNGAGGQQASGSMARPSDRQVAKDVRKAIKKAGGVDMAALVVRVKNGVVTLAGSVPAASEAARAAEVAKSVSGVVSVRNKLTVQTEEN